jgi:hypothetical protein
MIDNADVRIEGLAPGADTVAMADDVYPGGTQTTFYVESVEQFDGTSKNVLYVVRSNHLGAFSAPRPVNDKVEYDPTETKWKIIELVKGELLGPDGKRPISDIKRNPKEWNAFMRGTSQTEIGTPLSVLFKHDPARVDHYKGKYIHTLEALAGITDGQLDSLPFGTRADRDAARAALAKIQKNAELVGINNMLESMSQKLEAKDKQIEDLTAKLTQLLEAQLETSEKLDTEAPRKRGRPAKNIEEI